MCQFYPRDEAQRAMICGAAVKAGFGAGVLEDGAGTKGVKVYLVLTVGGGAVEGVVEGMEGVEVEGRGGGRGKGERRVREREREEKGGRRWILKKKERMERRGKVVKKDSKYTGRRRRVQF